MKILPLPQGFGVVFMQHETAYLNLGKSALQIILFIYLFIYLFIWKAKKKKKQ